MAGMTHLHPLPRLTMCWTISRLPCLSSWHGSNNFTFMASMYGLWWMAYL